MAETQTPNYHWIKPDLGGDTATWGNVLNTTFDAIDGVVFNNQQGVVPIGTIMMFGGSALPTNWLWCNGAVYLDTDVPALAPVLNHAFAGSDASHTAVPNLNARMPIGWDQTTTGAGWKMGLTGGEYNHALVWGELAAHYHNVWQDGHGHNLYQDAHSHAISVSAHTHSIYQDVHTHGDYGHGHGASASQDGHTHNVNQLMRFVGSGGSLGVAASPFNVATGGSTDGASANGVYVSIATGYASLDNRQPAIHCDTQYLTASADNRQPVVHGDTQTPAVHMDTQGSGTPHNNMPPFIAIGFIIRFK